MTVQTTLEHWVTIWSRPALQIIDTNERSVRRTTREMAKLLTFDSVGNLTALLDLKNKNKIESNLYAIFGACNVYILGIFFVKL